MFAKTKNLARFFKCINERKKIKQPTSRTNKKINQNHVEIFFTLNLFSIKLYKKNSLEIYTD